MGRRRIVLVAAVAAALGGMLLPAAAMATTYTWALSSNFTAAAPGANPDKGPYGDHPWSYLGGGGAFTSSFNGGLAGWKDSSGAFVAINPGGTPITNPSHTSTTYQPGQVVAQPSASKAATITWTSPLTSTATVTLTGSVVADDSGANPLLCPPATWSLDNNGSGLASGTVTSPPTTFNKAVTVQPGKAIHLVVSAPVSLLPPCDATGVNLTISAPAPDPVVTLDSLGPKPLTTSTPTFTGTASQDLGDGSQVGVAIFQGTSATGPWYKLLTAPIRSDGSFSVAAPSLPDGQYTAVAGQTGPSGAASTSPKMTFQIKVNPPVVTLSSPATGANVPLSSLTFAGTATTAFGDASSVTVNIYEGSSPGGRVVATAFGQVVGGRWSAPAPVSLAPGLYTAQATQLDDAGHIAISAAHTFLALPGVVSNGGSTIGGTVTLSRGGGVTVPIKCTAPSGQQCTGNVLILTTRNYRAAGGGPTGPLRLMFAYVSIPSGRTVVVRRIAPSPVRRLLTHARGVKVRVTARLSFGGGATRTFAAVRTLRVGG